MYDSSETRGGDNVSESGTAAWAARMTRDVATQIRYWRERRGLSAKQLSDRTEELGLRIARSVIANLENNRRDTVGVAEILVLAAALDVPPILLITPVGRGEAIEILPGIDVSPWLARGWLIGARHPGYRSFSHARWQDARRAIALYDIHRLLLMEHQQIQTRIKRLAEHNQLDARDIAGLIDDRRGQGALLNHAVEELAYSLDRIRQHRKLIRSEGFILPPLPPGLAVSLRSTEAVGRHHLAQAVEQDVDSDTEGEALLPPLLYEYLSSNIDESQRRSDEE